MPKRKPSKPPSEMYVLLGSDESYQGIYLTKDAAEIACLHDETKADGAVILKCTEAWTMVFPEEPEPETVPTPLDSIFE